MNAPLPPLLPRRIHWRPHVQLRKHRPRILGQTRPQQTHIIELWRTVNDFPRVNREGKAEAIRRLKIVCSLLDASLHYAPCRFTRIDADSVSYTLFNHFVVVMNHYVQSISYYAWEPASKQKSPLNYVQFFKHGRLLPHTAWLVSVIYRSKSLNLNLFVSDEDESIIEHWLAKTLLRLLHKDPRFQRLINKTLPPFLDLSPEFYGIAMAARPLPEGPLMNGREFEQAWIMEHQLSQTARENPQLLPLVFIMYPDHTNFDEYWDAVQNLKAIFAKHHLSNACWRYVCHYGSRIFRTLWQEIPRSVDRLDAAIALLRVLDNAGLPPPPPPSVFRALIHHYNFHIGEMLDFQMDWLDHIPSHVIRVGLIEADQRRHSSELADFIHLLLGICDQFEHHTFDQNQRDAGWPWLVEQYQDAQQEAALLSAYDNQHWPTTLPEKQINGYSVVPIGCSDDLIREGIAMRNCVINHIAECRSGEGEIYSVRHPISGKRLANFGFHFDYKYGTVIQFDAKGFANTPLPHALKQVGYKLWALLARELSKSQNRSSALINNRQMTFVIAVRQ